MTPHDTADGERVLEIIRAHNSTHEDLCRNEDNIVSVNRSDLETLRTAAKLYAEALQTAQPAVQPDEPPCGDKCPKDEDCGNFNFHGEGCAYDPKISKVKVWKAIKALAQAKFDFQVPMAANRTGAMLISEQVDLIEAALSFAYHKAEDTGEKYE